MRLALYGTPRVPEESPGEVIGEITASVAIGAPESKGLWKEVEFWHHVAGESLRKDQESLLLKVQPSYSRDSSILDMLPWKA